MCWPIRPNCSTGIRPRSPCRHRTQGERESERQQQLRPLQPLPMIPRGLRRQGPKFQLPQLFQKPSISPRMNVFPVSAEGGIKMLVRRKSSQPQRLFPFERVLEAADSVLNLASGLLRLAFGFELGVAGRLARDFLDFAFGLVAGTLDSILVHVFLSLLGSAVVTITIERLRSCRGFSDVSRLCLRSQSRHLSVACERGNVFVWLGRLGGRHMAHVVVMAHLSLI